MYSGWAWGQMCHHRPHFRRIGPGGGHPVLGAPHFAGGHHFHRLGDLPRAADALDLVTNFFCACHVRYPAEMVSTLPAAILFEIVHRSGHPLNNFIAVAVVLFRCPPLLHHGLI